MDSDIVIAQVVEEQPKPWGFWGTLGLSLVVMGATIFVQIVVTIAFVAVTGLGSRGSQTEASLARLGANGFLLSLATWAGLPFTLGLIALFVKLRRPWSLRDYLALRHVPTMRLLAWLGIVLLFVTGCEAVTWFVGRTPVTDFMMEIYSTAGLIPFLWITLVVAAPVGEEALFRGFMFRGIQQSRLGSVGAIVLTSLLWTISHVQYDAYQLAFVFGLGILFGIARTKSGSVYLTMIMHALVNLISLLETQLRMAA